jgi:hypothetical protein
MVTCIPACLHTRVTDCVCARGNEGGHHATHASHLCVVPRDVPHARVTVVTFVLHLPHKRIARFNGQANGLGVVRQRNTARVCVGLCARRAEPFIPVVARCHVQQLQTKTADDEGTIAKRKEKKRNEKIDDNTPRNVRQGCVLKECFDV